MAALSGRHENKRGGTTWIGGPTKKGTKPEVKKTPAEDRGWIGRPLSPDSRQQLQTAYNQAFGIEGAPAGGLKLSIGIVCLSSLAIIRASSAHPYSLLNPLSVRIGDPAEILPQAQTAEDQGYDAHAASQSLTLGVTALRFMPRSRRVELIVADMITEQHPRGVATDEIHYLRRMYDPDYDQDNYRKSDSTLTLPAAKSTLQEHAFRICISALSEEFTETPFALSLAFGPVAYIPPHGPICPTSAA